MIRELLFPLLLDRLNDDRPNDRAAAAEYNLCQAARHEGSQGRMFPGESIGASDTLMSLWHATTTLLGWKGRFAR